MSGTDSPSWLTEDNNTGGGAAESMSNDNVFNGTSETSNHTSETSNHSTNGNNSSKTMTTEASGIDDAEKPKKCCLCLPLWCKYFPIFITIVFVAIFAASAALQWNDDNQRLYYFIFYLFHAIFAFFGLFRSLPFCRAWSKKVFLGLGVGMWIWSAILVILSALDLANLNKNSSNYKTEKEEFVYEIAGCALGLVSATYHLLVIGEVCCFKSTDPEKDDKDDSTNVLHTPGEPAV